MGFAEGRPLSIRRFFRLTDLSLPPFKYSLTWYLFTGFVIVSTVLWGRLYCGRICAFGAMTQLLDRAVPAGWRVDVPRRVEKRAAYMKYALLAGSVAYFLLLHDTSIYRYVEPFWMFSGKATLAM